MNYEILNTIIKIFIINLMIYTCFTKINEERTRKIYGVFEAITITVVYILVKRKISDNIIIRMFFTYAMQILMLRMSIKDKNKSIIVSNLISNALVYTIFCISLFIELIPKIVFNIQHNIINMILTLIIAEIILRIILKTKKVKYGIDFLKNPIGNSYLCVILLEISAMVLFSYCIFVNSEHIFLWSNIFIFLVLAIIMILIIQRTWSLYYKQKLLAKNIEDYKSEIALKDAQIKSLSDEKYKISKLNHEFYNRQRALIHKVEEITSMNTEIADELDFSKQINDLTKEYTDKAQEIKTLDKLPTTGIVEIDDMFKYMQSECDSKKIQFNLKINGNIYHMINNKIPQSRLVTLIGDHLRDAIIAIDFSNNTFKSILAVLGENNGVYEFCVFDTGIEFKIDTLLNLGLKPATTHKDSGGTGIGFMTTFETMKETKASLIIDEMREMSNTDYTKSVTIRFDGKNEYRIKSYRSDEIKKKMKDNRIIIENKKGSSTQWN